MAQSFVRFKSRQAFLAVVKKLPAEWQSSFMSLLESVVFRNELEEFVAEGGDLFDHGDLSGLTDDDHTQYHNDTRALAWLGTRDITDLGTYDHTSLTSVGTNTHPQIDTHIADNTGHPNIVVSDSEPADGTLGTNEGAFWWED